jgi:ATP-dependent DNA helicase RecQ
MDLPKRLLKQHFGYSDFRPGQGEVVDRLLGRRDVLSVMPTGAGKSICYQIPALCMEGLTLVVSPLISLMKDQVEGLLQAGVPAAYLNSSLTERQFALALHNARMGKYKLIYVAPERLETASFLAFAREAPISMVAVDEAHCVSQWGQDFRPSYLAIPCFTAALPSRPVVAAFTATATPEVREDIIRQLELREPFLLVSGFDRPNLFWEVQTPRSKREALLAFLSAHEGESGLVYCSTRKNVEEVCAFLQERGFSATRYHAGLEPTERNRNQENFVYGSTQVIVATNAFGMGIDKPDVRYVVHYNMPKDLESYYQEAGRAGRDGDAAHCLLLYSAADIQTNRFLIEQQGRETETDEEERAHRVEQDLARLKQMTYYCHTTDCLRYYILRYFGEGTGEYCGNCGNCRAYFEERDLTEDAQKILSCVKRAGERFGASAIADVLRGAQNERVVKWQLHKLPTYGALSALSRDEVLSRIRLLLERGYLKQQDGPYPTLALTSGAGDILFRGEKLTARVKVSAERAAPQLSGQQGDVPPALYARLQQLRQQLAKRLGVPAYVVFSNETLREMCRQLPRSEGELLKVSGVGEQKRKKFGRAFLEAIETWRQEQGGT